MATLVLDRPTGFRGYTKTTPFRIDYDVPLPPRMFPGGSGRPAIYPFERMSVGDSFEITRSQYGNGKHPLGRVQSRIGNAARSFAKARVPYAKFTTRQTGPTTVRIWRTA